MRSLAVILVAMFAQRAEADPLDDAIAVLNTFVTSAEEQAIDQAHAAYGLERARIPGDVVGLVGCTHLSDAERAGLRTRLDTWVAANIRRGRTVERLEVVTGCWVAGESVVQIAWSERGRGGEDDTLREYAIFRVAMSMNPTLFIRTRNVTRFHTLLGLTSCGDLDGDRRLDFAYTRHVENRDGGTLEESVVQFGSGESMRVGLAPAVFFELGDARGVVAPRYPYAGTPPGPPTVASWRFEQRKFIRDGGLDTRLVDDHGVQDAIEIVRRATYCDRTPPEPPRPRRWTGATRHELPPPLPVEARELERAIDTLKAPPEVRRAVSVLLRDRGSCRR